MAKYRFSNAYETVHEYQNGAYVFIGSYHQYGITRYDDYDQAEKKIAEYEPEEEY